MSPMTELISEPITPLSGTFDATAMGAGSPGLPKGFVWRDEAFEIIEIQRAWKESSREGGRAQGELYLRRYYYALLMSDGRIWTVYFLVQPPRSTNPKKRWYLYTVETPETPGGAAEQ